MEQSMAEVPEGQRQSSLLQKVGQVELLPGVLRSTPCGH